MAGIFISYKFRDFSVRDVDRKYWAENENKTTVRAYVNILQEYFENKSNHSFRAEDDNESLEGKSDDQIWDHLKDYIFYTSVTILLISPKMKDTFLIDKKQWIPWELKYSIQSKTRSDNKSLNNGILAIVLPDKNGSYNYFYSVMNCTRSCGSTNPCVCVDKDGVSFGIFSRNTFNLKDKKSARVQCNDSEVYDLTNVSYIYTTKWDSITNSRVLEDAIKIALEHKENVAKYNISCEI